MTRYRPPLLLGITLSTGCSDADLWAYAQGLRPTDTDVPGASTTGDAEPATTTAQAPDSPVQTVTGGADDTHADATSATADPTATTASGPLDAPPEIFEFSADRQSSNVAGPIALTLHVSDDVTRAWLLRDEVQVAEFYPLHEQYVFDYEVLSAKDNGNSLTVRVEDASHQIAEWKLPLHVQLEPSGTLACSFLDQGAKTSRITALAYREDIHHDTVLLAAGARDTGGGERATLWMLPTQGCDDPLSPPPSLSPVPFWPRSIDWWSGLPEAAQASSAVAIAVDTYGSFALGANLRDEGDVPRPYVAMFNADGSLVWEKAGEPGDELAGLEILPDHSVVAVGATPAELSTDAAAWHYTPKGPLATIKSYTLFSPFDEEAEANDPENKRDERANAVVLTDDGAALIAGEREYRTKLDLVYQRGFTLRLDPDKGRLDALWTSPGDNIKKHDSILALVNCNGQILAGGWSSDNPADPSTTTPLIRWLALEGGSSGLRDIPLTATRARAISCDREGKVVAAGAREKDGHTFARVVAFLHAQDPVLKYIDSVTEEGAALALACDSLGYCAAGGFVAADAKTTAQLSVLRP